ncbi:hypothetical protein GGS20DRAFT_168513 [Poronia punctata]|nr:hypothetical protein GGS20DRAFT_168513 [Poronia punctata]
MTPSTTRLLANAIPKVSLSRYPNRLITRAISQTSSRRNDEKPSPANKRTNILTMLANTPEWQTKPQLPGRAPTGTAAPNSVRPVNQNSDVKDILDVIKTGIGKTNPVHPPRPTSGSTDRGSRRGPSNEPFHFHVYAHKHNTHITVTKPDRGAIISMSTGNIGFKKGKRGSYDAAHQLCTYVLDKLHQGGWHNTMPALEVVLRGFGQGREAAVKILLGSAGRLIRPLIQRVSDSTRLKFGGTRGQRPRRLG